MTVRAQIVKNQAISRPFWGAVGEVVEQGEEQGKEWVVIQLDDPVSFFFTDIARFKTLKEFTRAI